MVGNKSKISFARHIQKYIADQLFNIYATHLYNSVIFICHLYFCRICLSGRFSIICLAISYKLLLVSSFYSDKMSLMFSKLLLFVIKASLAANDLTNFGLVCSLRFISNVV